MKAQLSDERDVVTEEIANRFRVFFFTPQPQGGGPFAVECYDLLDCQAKEALLWAENNTNDRQYAVSLVTKSQAYAEGIHLIWLEGSDPNAA